MPRPPQRQSPLAAFLEIFNTKPDPGFGEDYPNGFWFIVLWGIVMFLAHFGVFVG